MKMPDQRLNTLSAVQKQRQAKILAPENESLDKPQKSIQEIRQILFNPQVISERYDRAGRRSVAAEITRRRQLSHSLRGHIDRRKGVLRQIEQQQISTSNALKAESLRALEQGAEHMLARLKSSFSAGDNTANEIGQVVTSLETDIDNLAKQAEDVRIELEHHREEQATVPDSEKLLEAYYEKMETVPLTNQEKRDLLKPEVLAELSTEEYVALWRRLNPYFLSHVTRQGFRDHNAMRSHKGGLQEFHSGFTDILGDGNLLRPPFAVSEQLRSRDDSGIRKFLEDWVLMAESEEEARKRLDRLLNATIATAPRYPDKTAVHFATEIVADGYYGGESCNEVFFVYPSDVLASQHNFAFNGSNKDFTQPQDETMWNDVFIWPSSQNNPGISVDAGVVFLPENTPVDPETGSKYASEIKSVEGEEKRVMVEDSKLIAAFVEWAENLNDESPVIVAHKEYNQKMKSPWTDRQDAERTLFDVFRTQIMAIGFSEEATGGIVRKLFGSVDGINQFQYDGTIGFGDSKKDAALKKLQSASANWKRATNAIPSKEYWNRYFTRNPIKKPKHLVFYNGDPTSAVYEFQRKNNIGRADVSKTEGKLLGFDDMHVAKMSEDPRARIGYDELVETALRVIAGHYRGIGAQ